MEKQVLILGAVVLVVVVAAIAFFAGGPGGGPVVVRFMGQPMVLTSVEGEDVSCVGAPSGYMRVYFDRTSDVDGEHVTVGYARKGDDVQSVTAWFEGRAEACGYTRVEKTTGAAMGAHGVSETYEKGDARLYFDVAAVPAENGETYTLVRIGLDIYAEEGAESGSEETGTEEAPQEVPASGNLKQWDDRVRPLLENAVGNLTLTNAVSAQSAYGLTYTADRPLTADDAQRIADQFTSAGWQQTGVEVSTDHVSIGFVGEAIVGVEYDVGGREIQVTILGG